MVDEIEGQMLSFFKDAPLFGLREHQFFLIIVFNFFFFLLFYHYYFIIITLLFIYLWYLWYAMALVHVVIKGIAYQYVMLLDALPYNNPNSIEGVSDTIHS